MQRVIYSTILGAGGSSVTWMRDFSKSRHRPLSKFPNFRALLDIAGTEGDNTVTEGSSIECDALGLTSQPPFTLDDLKSMTNKSEREIVFVDWVCLIGQIYMVAVGETGRPTIFLLLYSPQEILEWKNSIFPGRSLVIRWHAVAHRRGG